ncbi:hypothetical protein [Curtobacterium sp. VKM Ac-2887]|uniref:hypothetical protein n=1 Tax=Curtobacterium sp. VKM Ac-2887 TaxID=2783819 RepID=UPI001889E6D1|nr:hypothetical protein [Curtobacterium sp. VKM Ac-2887]MBF4587275.1 hypothetical protein [Curtobacterium sp. VKM Ac-2887]
MITAADLLDHPRGRRFCFELVNGVQQPDDPDAVASALAAVPLPVLSEDSVVVALESTAESALWWQPADATDALLSRPELRPALTRIARWAVDSPVVRQLAEPQGGAWTVVFDDDDQPRRPSTGQALRDWAQQLRDEVAAGSPGVTSGVWWTTPPWPLLQTTRAPFPSAGPLALWAVEDSFGHEHARALSTPIDPAARVFTVDGPDDWAALCRRWPLDVTTTTRRNDWRLATGRQGTWVLPDWSGVAAEYDVVHLTVAGWFRTSGDAVKVDDDRASVVAGWTPDSAYRLTEHDRAAGAGEAWARPGNFGVWRRLD